MKKTNLFLQYSIIYGSITATLLAWVAYFLFLVIDQLRLSMEFPDYFYLPFFIEKLFYGNAVLLFPTMFGGVILAYSVNQDAKKYNLSLNGSFLKGSFIGMLTGLGVTLLVWAYMISLRHGEPAFGLFLSRTLIAGLLGFASGGLTGRQLYYFHKNR